LTLDADDFRVLLGPLSGSPKNDSLGTWKQDVGHAMHKMKFVTFVLFIIRLVPPK